MMHLCEGRLQVPLLPPRLHQPQPVRQVLVPHGEGQRQPLLRGAQDLEEPRRRALR